MIKLTIVRSINKFLSSSNIEKQAFFLIQKSLFGFMLVVTIDNFLCMLKFLPNLPQDSGMQLVEDKFPFCQCIESENVINIFNVGNITNTDLDVQILAEGSEFYENVWRALLTIPRGTTLYYSDVANQVGKPQATRAVGSAVGKNPIAYLIPCHRVIGKNNNCFKFAAGPEIKKQLLESEGITVRPGAIKPRGLAKKSGPLLDRHSKLHSKG